MEFILHDDTHNAKLVKGHVKDLITNDTSALTTITSNLQKICNALDFNYEFGRGTCWLGEEGLDYRYTNKSHIAQGWHDELIVGLTASIRQLSEDLGFTDSREPLYNHLLINQYLPKQKLNMHRDNEPTLTGPLASFTLGAPSRFTYGLTKSIREGAQIELGDGDVLIGNREFFDNYYHSVAAPKVTEEHPVRYNFTWRTLK
jgi:alkylated DNA repair dioxygenase AlkB